MVAFVGDQIAGIFLCRGEAHDRKILLRLFQRRLEGRGVAIVGGVDWRCNDDPSVEIDRVFRFVGEMGRAVLHLGDLGIGIGRARPILVRQLLALRLRSSRMRSSIVGVATPLSSAIRVNIWR
jgi:hypothetical protein